MSLVFSLQYDAWVNFSSLALLVNVLQQSVVKNYFPEIKVLIKYCRIGYSYGCALHVIR